MDGFEDLGIWKKCRLFIIEISILLREFPEVEKYRLIDQQKHSSRSATANIAEDHGKFHYQYNLKLCRNARGFLNEVLDHLICAADELIINPIQLPNLREWYYEYFRLLNGYIAFLKKRMSRNLVDGFEKL